MMFLQWYQTPRWAFDKNVVEEKLTLLLSLAAETQAARKAVNCSQITGKSWQLSKAACFHCYIKLSEFGIHQTIILVLPK